MNTWTPLWSGTVESSLWDEDDYVVKVFLTMLATKDSDQVYRGDKYRDKVREEMKKARNRRAQAAYRERQKLKHGEPLPGEMRHEEAMKRGDEAGAQAAIDEHLPESKPEPKYVPTADGVAVAARALKLAQGQEAAPSASAPE